MTSCPPISLSGSPPSSSPWANNSPSLRWPIAIELISSTTRSLRDGNVISANIRPLPSILPTTVRLFQNIRSNPLRMSTHCWGTLGIRGPVKRLESARKSSPPLLRNALDQLLIARHRPFERGEM